ncbi:MAG: hypothetical protein AB7F75_06220 [Planctomycetota bacterium]
MISSVTRLILRMGFLSFLGWGTISCDIDPPHAPSGPTQAHAASAEELIIALIEAQERFFARAGRFSMTIDLLADRGYLKRETANVLMNRQPHGPWTFEQVDLPLPDEDSSWCLVARDNSGRVLLATFAGLWERQDGQCPLTRESLPPAAPWVAIRR